MSDHRGTFFSMVSNWRACVAVLFCAASLGVLVLRSHFQFTPTLRETLLLASVPRMPARNEPSKTAKCAAEISAEPVPDSPVLIGRASTAVFILANTSSSCTLRVDGAELSCSCGSILRRPSEVSPDASDTIVMGFTPGAFDDDTKVELSADLSGAYTGRLRCKASTSPIPPFSGWPRCARARQTDGWTVITLEPQYVEAGLPKQVSAFDRLVDTPLSTQVLGNELKIRGQWRDIDLVIHFGDDRRATWSGPVVITND